MKNTPTVEEMIADLLRRGWSKYKNHSTIWVSPDGLMFRGPHRAWMVASGSGIAGIPREYLWAVRGKHTDCYDNETILANKAHFEFWTWDQTHYPNGRQKFNLDFLGRWRSTQDV